MVLNLQKFNLRFSNFTTVQKGYALSQTLCQILNFDFFPSWPKAVGCSLMILGSGTFQLTMGSLACNPIANQRKYEHTKPTSCIVLILQ